MRRILVIVLALGASVLSMQVPASADPARDWIQGGCFFSTDRQQTVTGDQYVGVIGDYSVTSSGPNPVEATPVAATVTCSVEVNGVEAPGTRFSYSGFGIQKGVDRISYAANDDDRVTTCEQVDYADGTTYLDYCEPPDPEFPPEWIYDIYNGLFDDVNGVLGDVGAVTSPYVDPVLCPQLAAAAGTYGPVTIAPDGDLVITDPLGLLIVTYDCPPYAS